MHDEWICYTHDRIGIGLLLLLLHNTLGLMSGKVTEISWVKLVLSCNSLTLPV